MELGSVLNHDLPSPKQRPAWYRGEKLIKSLDTDLWGISGHELDEIIHEILTNPKFKWNGENGIASFLGLNVQPMKGTNWTWTKRKIQFANIAAETPYRDSAIFKIAGRHAER